MNPLPILALAVVGSGYAVATERLNASFQDDPVPMITAYPAGEALTARSVGTTVSQAIDAPHCAPHAQLTDTLAHDFAEHAVDNRVEGDGLQMELWASELMGTWTVVHKGSDGVSCVVSSGIGWTSAATPGMVFDTVSLSS